EVVASRQASLGAARAELERAQQAWIRAKQELERVDALVKQNLVAKRDHDQATTDERSWEAAVRGAEQRVIQAQRDLASAAADHKMHDSGFEPSGIGMGMAQARAADARAKRSQAEAMVQDV